MPGKAVLPTAEPPHDGLAALRIAALEVRSVKVISVPSVRVYDIACPAVERAALSL